MSEEAPTLEGELLKWAKGNETRKNKWLTELIENDVEDLQTLKERAESSRWNRTLDKLSDGLVAKLESWFSDTFPQSKPSGAQFLNFYICFFFWSIIFCSESSPSEDIYERVWGAV